MNERIEQLLEELTLEEKVTLCAGKGVMETMAVERLGIPQLRMADGPHGVRDGKATSFPTGISMGASWNPDLIARFGAALARETIAKERNLILGPCVNIHRTPLGGRNFESFTEDPFLASRLAVAYVKSVQALGVGTSTKHFACNNQEWERHTISARVDERTLREIYLPAFEAAVLEAHTWTVMGAYNRLNGTYCCANTHLNDEILKGEWGFSGLVMSDWGATHGTVDFAHGGLDLEMPGPPAFFGDKLLAAVKQGEVSEEVLDDKVRRLLRVMMEMGLFEQEPSGGEIGTEKHRQLAREMAEEAIVLLKNEDALPLDAENVRKIAVIGPNADVARMGGGGSSTVTPEQSVSILEGIRTRFDKAEVVYALGCALPGDLPPVESRLLRTRNQQGETVNGLTAEIFDNCDLEGEPVATRVDSDLFFDWAGCGPLPDMEAGHYSIRWTGQLVPERDGDYEIGITAADAMVLYFNGERLINYTRESGVDFRTERISVRKGEPCELRVEYRSTVNWSFAKLGWMPAADLEHAVALAGDADAAIVVGGLSATFEGEGHDRHSMVLPGRQDDLIKAVAEANPRTVVVLVNGTPVEMDAWLSGVPAVVEAWYPGQEGGDAVAGILAGDVNPSGRLPVTFPKKLEDNPSHGNYPGGEGEVVFEEGLFVGYRHYDRHDIEPLFPFGHGLSYTVFTYDNLDLETSTEGVQVSVDVTNAGACEGSDVVQVYVADPESRLPRPPQELKGFQKVKLAAGERRTVTIQLNERAFQYYDPDAGEWVLESGEFDVLVGRSSRDIVLRGTVVR